METMTEPDNIDPMQILDSSEQISKFSTIYQNLDLAFQCFAEIKELDTSTSTSMSRDFFSYESFKCLETISNKTTRTLINLVALRHMDMILKNWWFKLEA